MTETLFAISICLLCWEQVRLYWRVKKLTEKVTQLQAQHQKKSLTTKSIFLESFFSTIPTNTIFTATEIDDWKRKYGIKTYGTLIIHKWFAAGIIKKVRRGAYIKQSIHSTNAL